MSQGISRKLEGRVIVVTGGASGIGDAAVRQELGALHPGIVETDTLQASLGESASRYPKPEDWARVAVPFLLRSKSTDNGRQLSVPGTTTFLSGHGKDSSQPISVHEPRIA